MQNLKSTLPATNCRFCVGYKYAQLHYQMLKQSRKLRIADCHEYMCVVKLWAECDCLGTSMSMARPALGLTQLWPCASPYGFVTASVMSSWESWSGWKLITFLAGRYLHCISTSSWVWIVCQNKCASVGGCSWEYRRWQDPSVLHVPAGHLMRCDRKLQPNEKFSWPINNIWHLS